MAQKCELCKIVEKYKYWSQLPPTKHRFFKVLHSLHHLEIPTKFMECFQEKLAPWCTIIGPSEEKWKVKFTKLVKEEASPMQFSDGWEKFVSDNRLQLKDILMFRYVGDSSFEVCVFDESGCERESSYFAANTSTRQRPMLCASSLHRGMASCSASSSSKNSEDVVEVDSEESIREESVEKSEQQEEEEKEDSSWENEDESDDEEMEVRRVNKRTRGNSSNEDKCPQTPKCYISKRRKLTEDEKLRAANLAMKFLLRNRKNASVFRITMLPTHVYRGFHLTIPKTWALTHMLKEPHEVELRVPITGADYLSWFVGCRWTLTSVKQCQFRPMWSKFVLDNNLEEHDVCVFELIQKGESKKKTPIFNVHIFRAIDHIVPLTVSRQKV